MSDQDGIVACMRLNKKLTDRLNWFKDQVSPSMWPDHGLANLQKLARSIRVNGSEHTVDRILDAFVNNELPWVAPESLYDIPPCCIKIKMVLIGLNIIEVLKLKMLLVIVYL